MIVWRGRAGHTQIVTPDDNLVRGSGKNWPGLPQMSELCSVLPSRAATPHFTRTKVISSRTSVESLSDRGGSGRDAVPASRPLPPRTDRAGSMARGASAVFVCGTQIRPDVIRRVVRAPSDFNARGSNRNMRDLKDARRFSPISCKALVYWDLQPLNLTAFWVQFNHSKYTIRWGQEQNRK